MLYLCYFAIDLSFESGAQLSILVRESLLREAAQARSRHPDGSGMGAALAARACWQSAASRQMTPVSGA